MSPKIKSVLSVIATFIILFTFIAYKFLSGILAFFASTVGLLIVLLFILIIPYLLYRVFLKIYS